MTRSWRTRLIHPEAGAPAGFQSLAFPTYRGSTTLFPSARSVSDHWDQHAHGYTYGLYGTPTTLELAGRIADLEGGAHTILVSGGQAALVLVSGVYITASQMPEPLATISIFSPATYVIEGIRSALIDGKGFGDLWLTMLGLVASGLVMVPLGVMVFSAGERYAKRTGRLKRSG